MTGVQSWDQLEAIHQATTLPLMLGGAPADMADRERLASLGVRIALQGHMPFYAAIKAVYDTLKHLRDGGSPADLSDKTASAELLDIAMRRPDYARWQREYLQ
jgi:carboxyvinyl-carboxyphosphonate phosphorylmutase